MSSSNQTINSLLSSLSSCCTKSSTFLYSLITPLNSIELTKYTVSINKLIADGATGMVYSVSDQSGNIYALKKIIAQSEEQVVAAMWETKIYQEFASPSLVPLIDFKRENDKDSGNVIFYFLFPYYDYTLETLLSNRSFNELEVLQLFYNICLGVLDFHTHNPPLSHRDLKPGNILLRLKNNFKNKKLLPPGQYDIIPFHAVLTDFGSAANARIQIRSRRDAIALQELCSINCTISYRAPELFDVSSHCNIDERSDIWSLGCVLYALAFHHSPFDLPDNNAGGSIALAVVSGKYDLPSSPRLSKGFESLISAMLQVKASERPFLPAIIERVETLIQEMNGTVVKPSKRCMEINIGKCDPDQWSDETENELKSKQKSSRK